jgi:hypothetical protein
MKRSIFLLIYSILYTAFPFLMVWSLFYINDVKAYDSNGMNWGFAYFLVLVLLTTLVMGITGCVLCWIAYKKNSLSSIQVSLLFMGTFVALYYPIPNQTFIPIGMFILGTVSYFDLRRILKMTT